MSTTFHLQNFGCRATQADGAAIERELARRGWSAAEAGEAEVAVLNTCTVTASADADARAAIRRIHRENPECKILVTGCYAQRAPEELAALPGVAWVVGNSHKHEIGALLGASPQGLKPLSSVTDCGTLASRVRAEALTYRVVPFPKSANREFVPLTAILAPSNQKSEIGNQKFWINHKITNSPSHQILVGDIFAHTELLAAPVFDLGASNERTRPNLKAQDGCNNRCSFCVIPSVRGRSRSLPVAGVLREVGALVEMGYREVVISGINLGQWGKDVGGEMRFVDLVRAIVNETALEKLRISSVEPMDWRDELIELVATHPRIARHAHVPLQSGSDAVLRRMHRRYRPWHYAQRIEKIRESAPTAAIGADVMTGFPGETEAEFEESRAFIASLPFTYLHVFTFSARPGTPGAAMPNQVPVEVARERTRILRELSAQKNLQFRRSFVGGELAAITLQRANEGFTEAITDNYLKLSLRGEHAANRWMQARIEGVTTQGLIGSRWPEQIETSPLG